MSIVLEKIFFSTFAAPILMSDNSFVMRKKIFLFVLVSCTLGMLAQAQENRLDINNVDIPITPRGGGWFLDDNVGFRVPKGSEQSTYFCYSFWMGAKDDNAQLHLFADRFNQVGNDTWPGPLSTVDASIDAATKQLWDRTFKITRQEVMDFLANRNTPGYTIPQHILDWPAHGDTTKGQAWLLAPFVDENNNNRYEPELGDYPAFPGDMAQFIIFNDNYSTHTESQGLPLGVEVHVMAYAYNVPGDTIMNNTIFLKYKIFNRSQNNYHNAYIGLWSDWDLGYGNDDYVGCDVMKNSVYCYNGSEIDGSGQSNSYGADWPVQTLTLLSGPLMPADSIDNPAYSNSADCFAYFYSGNALDRYAINGTLGFGDSIVDNERYGLTGFISHNNEGTVYGDPSVAAEYYNSMMGIWKDNTKMRYGGGGHSNNGGNGPECNFLYPSMSDPCNIGTYGMDPYPEMFGVGGWTEYNASNTPGDRRGLASVGPFNLSAGGMDEVELCLVTIPHTWAINGSVANGIIFDSLYHVNPVYLSPLGVEEHPSKTSFNLYPNPTTNFVTVEVEDEDMVQNHEPVMVFDIFGKLLYRKPLSSTREQIDLSSYAPGVYVVKVGQNVGKVIKR